MPSSRSARDIAGAGFALLLTLIALAVPSVNAAQLEDVFEADFYRPTAFLDERDRQVTERLEAAHEARVDENWRGLVQALQDVLLLDGIQNAAWGPRTYRDARLEARGQLLAAPAPAREIYYQLFEARAAAELAEAQSERRADVWRSVAERYPLSDAAAEALDRLAGLCFETGRHSAAAHWSERLEELHRARGEPLSGPATARWLVSLARLGDAGRINSLVEKWLSADARATVSIGESSRPLVDFRRNLLVAPDSFGYRPPSFSAHAVELAWTHSLSVPRADDRPRVAPVGVVVGDRLYVHSASGLAALDVRSGSAIWQVDTTGFQARILSTEEARSRESWTTDLGIAADTERLYLVRSGIESYRDVLICLSAEDGRMLWRRGVAADESLHQARLCRTPEIDGKTLYVSATIEASPLESRLVALDAESGEILWSRFIAAGRPLVAGDRFNTSVAPPVTPGDPQLGPFGVTLLTNLGVVACVDPWEERVRWIFHYSRVRDDRSLPPEKIGYFEVSPWRRGELVLRPDEVLVTPGDSEWAYALSHVPDADGHMLKAPPLFKAPRSLRELIGAGDGLLLFEQIWERRSRIASYSNDFELRWVSMPITARERLVGLPLVTQEQVIYATSRRLYFLDLARDGALVHMQAAPELAPEIRARDRERSGRFLIGGGLLITLSRSSVLAWSPK